MKNAIVAAVLVLGIGQAWGAEYLGNPDRVPSIGLNFGGVSESGDATVLASPSAKQDLEISNGHLILDLRLPVSNNVTFNGSIGISGSESEAKETPMLFGQRAETSGVSFNVGVRFYLH